MKLQEQVLRIQEMMGVKQEKPSEKLYQQALEDIGPLIPELAHKIMHEKGLKHDRETLIDLNNQLLELVKKGDDKTLDDLWEIAWSMVVKNAINIITAYHKD